MSYMSFTLWCSLLTCLWIKEERVYYKAQLNDNKENEKGKGYGNNARQAKPSNLKFGDKVFFVADNKQHQVRRKTSFIKKGGEEETEDEDYNKENAEKKHQKDKMKEEWKNLCSVDQADDENKENTMGIQ